MAKMYRNSIFLLIIGSVGCFLYGIFNIGTEIEPNACRMTYMFGQPMFARVSFTSNRNYPNYGLYYYYEGIQSLDIRSIKLNGAPVIFVPGNAGSYKQVRSLASVALRKAMDNEQGIHLDYFTVDYNEELSGLYGGYLAHQRAFLKHCIKAVLRLYKGYSKVVIIGHSMGGKVAQSLLTDPDIAKSINSIIFISTPIDEPVLNLDEKINNFYQSTNNELLRRRTAILPGNNTNVCNARGQTQNTGRDLQNEQLDHSGSLDNILLISTGGGNRDLLVRSGLTTSQFSDIHAMTSAIPKVGISCDHLSAVWCLQFMLVINRFLFNIASVQENHRYVVFNENKKKNLETALHFFVKPHHHHHHSRAHKLRFRGIASVESQKLVFNKHFDVLREEFNQLINIVRPTKYKKLYIESVNVDKHMWLYGCVAKKNKVGGIYCENATSLAHHTQQLPFDKEKRSFALLDLHNLRNTYKKWTHLLIQLPVSYEPSGFNIDLHDPAERTFDVKLTIYYSLQAKLVINETKQDTIYYKLLIEGVTDPFHALRIIIEPLACKHQNFRITARICVPWAAGFERSQVLNATTIENGIYVNVPTLAPRGYNTTKYPVVLELGLDPICRYRISYQFSVADSMARLVQEFYGWLPSHLIAVLLIVLKNQIDKFEVSGTFRSLRPYTGYFQYSSLYIVTGCRLLRKLLWKVPLIPQPAQLNYCIHLSIIIHSSAIMLSIFASLAVWTCLVMYGNIIFSIAQRLTRMPQALSNILISTMTHLPMTFGIFTIALAVSTCSGISLIVACVFYFILLTNAYKDYLEDLLWQKAMNILKSVNRSQSDNKTGANGNRTGTGTATGTGTNTNAFNDEIETFNGVNDENNFADLLKLSSDDINIETNDELEKCFGLQNFPYHITLFLLTILMSALNISATIAWIHAKRIGIHLPDPALLQSILVLSSLSVILQLKAPNKLSSMAYRFISIILYFCAAYCILYCQLEIYRLNNAIATVFVLVAVHELFGNSATGYKRQR